MKTNTGIYQIYFTEEIPKRYIGSSADIKQRWSRHKYRLKKDNHANKPLQEAYNKYGIDNLKFFVIEYLPDGTPQDVLYAVEQYWIDTVGFDNLYNVCPTADGSEIAEDTKQKISETRKGKTHNEDTKQKISEALSGEKNPMHGRKHTDGAKQKISEANSGEK